MEMMPVMTSPASNSPADQPMWSVFLLNDEHTPMEFVVYALEQIFDADHESASRIMLEAHNKGIAECGLYPHDLAKTKATRVSDLARQHRHPLQCVIERKQG